MTLRNSAVAVATAFLCVRCAPAALDEPRVDDRSSVPDSDEGAYDMAAESVAAAGDPVLTSAFIQGTGCPAGTARVAIQQENGTPMVAFFFDAFKVNGRAPIGGRAVGVSVSCSLAVGLRAPARSQIAIVGAETRGHVNVAGRRDTTSGINNAVAVSREFFFASPSSESSNTYIVNTSNAFSLEQLTTGNVSYAGCDQAVLARARLALNVTGANNYGDIADASGALRLKLIVRPCSATTPGPAVIQDIVKNACVLRGIGTSSRTRVCYGASGEVVSSTPDL